ncbi:MAG: hypothetical protein OXH00_10925, partial [Candidatus Poribacteria bacterium]|nr:hypothetical protein [Candidatus Poribacteria bacterium]
TFQTRMTLRLHWTKTRKLTVYATNLNRGRRGERGKGYSNFYIAFRKKWVLPENNIFLTYRTWELTR